VPVESSQDLYREEGRIPGREMIQSNVVRQEQPNAAKQVASRAELAHRFVMVTLPTFNEADRLEGTLKRLVASCESLGLEYAISIVEDGSSDDSARIAGTLANKHPLVHFIHSDERLGRGEAIRRYWRDVKADAYVFMDVDLSTDLSFLSPLLAAVEEGFDVVTGSRYCPGARVSRPLLREIVSAAYNGLVRWMFGDGISDHQCGFKAFSSDAVRDLLPLTTEPTWFWDTEVLVLAQKLGYAVAEIPVVWTEMKFDPTPVRRLLEDVFLHGTGLIRLRMRISRLDRSEVSSRGSRHSQLTTTPASSREHRGVRSQLPGSPGLMVNNYAHTGIGDFGFDLHAKLKTRGIDLRLSATPMTWKGFLGHIMATICFDGQVVYNVGLTSWGRSPLRNFLGFLSILVRYKTGKKDVLLLHNLAEAVDVNTSGFHVSSLVTKGAHLAINQVRDLPIVVFSRNVRNLLMEHYGIVPAFWHPIPVEKQPMGTKSKNDVPVLLAIGYLAPYKGYGLLLDVLKEDHLKVETLLVGDEHKLLSQNPAYQQFVSELRLRAAAQGVTLLPKVPTQDLPEFMSRVDLGVLPYSASQGASAAAALLTSYQIPILATDLPEFQELANLGAGVVLSPSDPAVFAHAMKDMLEDPTSVESLREKQRQYADKYSWDNFLGRLEGLLGQRGD